jgi:hypothetical protein
MDDIFISQKTFLEHIHHFRSCAIYSENSGGQADSVKSIHRWFSSLWEIIALMLSESDQGEERLGLSTELFLLLTLSTQCSLFLIEFGHSLSK